MKKLTSLALTLCLIISFLVCSAYAEIDEYGRDLVSVEILTPVGTAISVQMRDGELTDDELYAIAQTKAVYEARGAVQVSESSFNYNCFAFAMLSRDVDALDLWLTVPSAFIEDGSFIEIDEPVIGCVVFYEEHHNYVMEMSTVTATDTTSNTYPFGEEDAYSHAGVVVSIDRGDDGIITDDEVTIVSKWGMGGLYMHTITCSPYCYETGPREALATMNITNNDGQPATCRLYCDYTYLGARYFVPNPEVFGGLTIKNDTKAADQQGLYRDAAGDIRFYVGGKPIEAGLVSDANGNYYYIDGSLKAVRNTTLTLSLSHTNGLLPDGTYTVGANGAITKLPEVLVGESFRDGLLKLPDGQIKAVQDGYPVSGAGVIRVDDAFYYAPKLETSFAKTAGGYDFDMMTTDGAVDTISADELNGLLPAFDYVLGEDGKIANLPTKLDSMTWDFGTGLMRMPDKTIALYENGVPCTDATEYTDPATGITYTFRFGGKTYTTNLPTATVKVTARNALRFR